MGVGCKSLTNGEGRCRIVLEIDSVLGAKAMNAVDMPIEERGKCIDIVNEVGDVPSAGGHCNLARVPKRRKALSARLSPPAAQPLLAAKTGMTEGEEQLGAPASRK
jgi:hypothetical protein